MNEQAQLSDSELELLSRSMDEELSELELKRLSKNVLSKLEAEKKWERYHAASAVMQKQFPASIDSDFSDSVMRAIENDDVDQESTVTMTADTKNGGGAVRSYMKQFAGLAVAASVAAVSVVVYQQQTQPGLDGGSSVIIRDKREIQDFQPNSAAKGESLPVEFSPIQVPSEDDIIGLNEAEENSSDLPEEDIIKLKDIKK